MHRSGQGWPIPTHPGWRFPCYLHRCIFVTGVDEAEFCLAWRYF